MTIHIYERFPCRKDVVRVGITAMYSNSIMGSLFVSLFVFCYCFLVVVVVVVVVVEFFTRHRCMLLFEFYMFDFLLSFYLPSRWLS